MYHLKANGILFSRQSLESKVIPKHKHKDTRIDGLRLCALAYVYACVYVCLNSNPRFFLYLNTSVVFTNYQPSNATNLTIGFSWLIGV